MLISSLRFEIDSKAALRNTFEKNTLRTVSIACENLRNEIATFWVSVSACKMTYAVFLKTQLTTTMSKLFQSIKSKFMWWKKLICDEVASFWVSYFACRMNHLHEWNFMKAQSVRSTSKSFLSNAISAQMNRKSFDQNKCKISTFRTRNSASMRVYRVNCKSYLVEWHFSWKWKEKSNKNMSYVHASVRKKLRVIVLSLLWWCNETMHKMKSK